MTGGQRCHVLNLVSRLVRVRDGPWTARVGVDVECRAAACVDHRRSRALCIARDCPHTVRAGAVGCEEDGANRTGGGGWGVWAACGVRVVGGEAASISPKVSSGWPRWRGCGRPPRPQGVPGRTASPSSVVRRAERGCPSNTIIVTRAPEAGEKSLGLAGGRVEQHLRPFKIGVLPDGPVREWDRRPEECDDVIGFGHVSINGRR